MRKFLVAALVLSLGAAPGCSQRQRTKIETQIASALVSEKQERQLGREIHAELDRQGVKYVKDPLVVGYVEGIAERLADEVRRKGAADDIHVHVIDEPNVVNAFATPGGHLYVFSGLLLAAEDEAEVAGVMGHELGHIVARHPARRLALATGYSALAGIALGQDPHQLAQIAAQLVGGGVLAAHGRGEENEADQLGLQYLHRSGYDPRGMVRFFKRIRELNGDLPGVLSWLSTHPTTTSRIENVREVIRARGWEGGKVGEETHADIQRALRPQQQQQERQQRQQRQQSPRRGGGAS